MPLSIILSIILPIISKPKVVSVDVMEYALVMINLTLVDMTRIEKRQPFIYVKNTSKTLNLLIVS